MKFILKLISAACISSILCNGTNYEGIEFWIAFFVTYFALIMLFDIFSYSD